MEYNIYRMVIPYNCASYLKRNGVPQISLFYWIYEEGEGLDLDPSKHFWELIWGKKITSEKIPNNYYSAFLSDELYYALEGNKNIRLEDLQMFIRYKKDDRPSYELNQFTSIGTALLEFMEFTEQNDKELRKERAKRAPQSPKKPNANGNFK